MRVARDFPETYYHINCQIYLVFCSIKTRMSVDSVIIISLVVACLAFFLLVGIFSAIFYRELGKKHREKLEEGEDSEREKLTPVAVQDEAQLDYTTETVQPESKTPVSGYPHVLVNFSELFISWLFLVFLAQLKRISINLILIYPSSL